MDILEAFEARFAPEYRGFLKWHKGQLVPETGNPHLYTSAMIYNKLWTLWQELWPKLEDGARYRFIRSHGEVTLLWPTTGVNALYRDDEEGYWDDAIDAAREYHAPSAYQLINAGVDGYPVWHIVCNGQFRRIGKTRLSLLPELRWYRKDEELRRRQRRVDPCCPLYPPYHMQQLGELMERAWGLYLSGRTTKLPDTVASIMKRLLADAEAEAFYSAD